MTMTMITRPASSLIENTTPLERHRRHNDNDHSFSHISTRKALRVVESCRISRLADAHERTCHHRGWKRKCFRNPTENTPLADMRHGTVKLTVLAALPMTVCPRSQK